MFNFFKRKKEDWLPEKQMLIGILAILPDQFKFLKDQVNDGLILGLRRSDSVIPNYYKVVFNVDILNKYEDKDKGYFRLTGPEVLDLNSNKYSKVDIYFYSNILQGFSTPMIKEIRPEVQNIRLRSYYLQSLESDDYERSKTFLDKAALPKINPNDVYEITLNGKTYYHLKDLEDGDFIGIDEEKRVYKITHDPYEFVELSGSLADILERKNLGNG